MPGLDINSDDQELEPLINRFLLTTVLLKRICAATSQITAIKDIGDYGFSLATGHLLITFFLSMIGGILAIGLSSQNPGDTEQGLSERENKSGKRGIGWIASRVGLFASASLSCCRTSFDRNARIFPVQLHRA